MKRIVVVSEYMLCGGVEKSLLSLLNYLDSDKYDITLLLLKKKGILLDQVPDYVKVIEMDLPKEEEYDILYGKSNALKKALKEKKYFLFIKKFIRGCYLNIISNSDEKKRVNYYKMIDEKFSELDETYDIAIDYMGYGLLNTFFVSKKINAKKKFSWIHFDPMTGMSDFKALKYYLINYNKIVCVSNDIKKQVLTLLPELDRKVCVFYNIIDQENIINKAKLKLGFKDKTFRGKRILSIGRLDVPKGFDAVVPIIKRLVDEGYNLRWYIIGEGSLRTKLETLINLFNMENNIILLGQKVNPYPYLQQCDYYFQPSKHEGYGIAVAEARAFCKPILATDFAGAKEQLKNRETGLIVRWDEEDIYYGLKELLDNGSLSDKFINNLKRNELTTDKIKDEIKELLED